MSNLIPRSFINELLSRCDLVEVIDKCVSLRKRGNNYIACCPFHEEKTPSFTVSQSKQIYHCFGCGVSGNAISFLIDYERLSFVEAVEQLAQQFGLEVPREAKSFTNTAITPDLYQIMEKAARFYQQQLRAHQPAIEYLKNRHLTGQIAKQFGLGYASAEWDSLLNHFRGLPDYQAQLVTTGLVIKKNANSYYDRFRDRIMFPIRCRRGRVIGFGGRIIDSGEPKYLNSPETIIFHKGSELYGLYEATQAQRKIPFLFVVEGYMDVVALAQHGITNVVATLGTATTSDHIQRLLRVTSQIVFCFDGDQAGQAAAWRALDVSLPLLQDGVQIQFLLLPEKEDPDSMVRKEGMELFLQRAQHATSLEEFLFGTLQKQANLSTLEGKAHFAKLAIALIDKLPEGVLRHLLLDRLAKLVRMEQATLKRFLSEPISHSKNKIADKKQTFKRSPMRVAIALLLQNPQLVQSLNDKKELLSNAPGSDILKELISYASESNDLNTAALLEYWREKPELKLLQQLAGLELNIPAGGLEQEFLGVLEKLCQLDKTQEIDNLMQKANILGLTSEEKLELQALIVASKIKN